MHCSTSLHKVMMQKFQSHPSINVPPLIRNLVLVAPGQLKCSRRSFPNQCFPAFLEGPQGIARPDGFSNPPLVSCESLVGHLPSKTSPGAQYGRYCCLFNTLATQLGLFGATEKWFYPMLCWSLSSFFPRLNPKILQRNLISAAGTCDLIFLVFTQTIWPWSAVGT